MKLRFVLSGIAAAMCWLACESAVSQPSPDWTIYSPSLDLRLSVSASHAGAITSLKYHGIEWVDNADHGRQIQTALKFNDKGECYNPNEAGTLSDTNGSSSKSQLWGLTIPSSNRLQTMTNMAYWFVSGDPPPFGQSCAVSSTNPSDFVLEKDVTISPAGFPANVIDYESKVTIAPNPPEAIFSSSTEAPASALKYPLFSYVYTYDLATRQSLPLQELSGEDITVKILEDYNGSSAFAIFAPELLQPYEGNAEGAAPSTFRWWIGADGTTSSLGTQYNEKKLLPPQSTLSYRTYLVVGTAAEVISSLNSLDVKFSTLDPDVFSWREYLRLNTDLPQTWNQAEAQSHWLNTGIGEGRAASYNFSSEQYRSLNSADLGWWSYQTLIDHYIGSGRKEGRATSPKVDGGFQHTLVRSPQQGFVAVHSSGANANGQLGNGTTTRTSSPVEVPHFGYYSPRVSEVAAGNNTSLAVLADGTVWMWGSNGNGARGDGSVGGQNNSPVQVPYLPQIVVPSTKDRHVVAVGDSAYAVVDYSGRVWTWGYGGNGQLGNGSSNSRWTPGVVQKTNYGGDLTGIVSISVGGGNFMVALDVDGHVWTWGYNGNGQLSDNSTTTKYQAVQAQTACCGRLGGITQIVTGGSFGMALARDGVLWAWGNNGNGQLGLGNGDTTMRTGATPVAIPWPLGTRDHIDKIAVGSNHAVAHARDTGNIYVWGYNGWGQLGLPPGYPVNNSSPTAMPVSDSTTNITDVGAGTFFTFLIRANKTERKIFGFGDNQSGQLGLNHYMTQTTPALTSF